jgi:hypothetical protein
VAAQTYLYRFEEGDMLCVVRNIDDDRHPGTGLVSMIRVAPWAFAILWGVLAGCEARPTKPTTASGAITPQAIHPDAAKAGAIASEEPLHRAWLGGATTVTLAHIEVLRRVGADDPNASALFREAEQRIGGGTAEGLAARVSICGADEERRGHTEMPHADAMIQRSSYEVRTGTRSRSTEEQLSDFAGAPARDLRTIEHLDFIELRRTSLPQICLRANLSVVEAYETLVHELVHAVRADPWGEEELAATVADEPAFLSALSLMAGSEVDAYVMAAGAIMHLRCDYHPDARLERLFDPRTLKLRATREEVATIIVQSKPVGFGYGDGSLRGRFAQARRGRLESLSAKRALVATLLTGRRKVIAADSDFLRSGKSKERGAQAIADSRDSLAAARLSEGRLTKLSQDLDVEIARLARP